MNYNRVSHNLDAVRTSDGVVIPANADKDPSTFGVTLVNGVTYVFPFGADISAVPSQSMVVSAQLRWDNAIAMSVTLEETLWPQFSPSDLSSGITDVSQHSTTVGHWSLVRPPDAYVEVSGGGSYTIATGVVAVVAGQAGGVVFNLALWGARRGRFKIVVGGTGGLVRCAVHGKAAA